MALANYTFAAAGPASSGVFADTSPAPLRADLDDLLYSPEDHQLETQPTISDHEPFAPPTNHRRSKLRKRGGPSYLPPPNQFTHYPRPDEVPQNPYSGIPTHVYQPNTRLDVQIENQRVHEINPPQYDNSGQYVHDPSGDYDYEQRRLEQGRQAYRPGFGDPPYPPAAPPPQSSRRYQGNYNQNSYNYNVPQQHIPPPTAPPPLPQRPQNQPPPPPQPAVPTHPAPSHNPPSYTKVEQSGSGGKTQLHAILDYDDDNYDEIPAPDPAQITPVQGPILVRNGTVPVVPLTSYPTTNNGSLYQIPLLWTALSVALGYELQGQVIKGLPCVKRNFQLYCPTAGNTYPKDKIDLFIDENKALIKRMYGSFTTPGGNRVRRAPGVPDMHTGDSYFRHVRQASASSLPDLQSINGTGKLDVCESRTEITTPYWALNSAKKIRAIVNTMHFEQAIHQEVCSKSSTARCTNDCGCEQKYKWHRLLAYDPTDDCAGIFMDWFLFPSCCVCRCKP